MGEGKPIPSIILLSPHLPPPHSSLHSSHTPSLDHMVRHSLLTGLPLPYGLITTYHFGPPGAEEWHRVCSASG